jgi:hypothetical protein
MATTTETLAQSLPPSPAQRYLFQLYYRQGSNPHPNFVFFYHNSKDMKSVTERSKRHCEVMNYRFVYVKAAIVDLDAVENILIQREG